MKKQIKKQVVHWVKPRLSAVFYKKLRHVCYTTWFSLERTYGRLRRLIIRPPLPINKNTQVYLHLGCGDIEAPGFINIDAVPRRHVHYVRSIDNLSMFKEGSVDFIFASHCLEHFPHRSVMFVLAEWYRVIKKGGILCLSVPDFNQLLDIYFDNDKKLDAIQGYLMGGQDNKYNFHHIAFNYDNLSDLLHQVGFSVIREWIPYSDELHSVAGFSGMKAEVFGKHYPFNLNLEAIK